MAGGATTLGPSATAPCAAGCLLGVARGPHGPSLPPLSSCPQPPSPGSTPPPPPTPVISSSLPEESIWGAIPTLSARSGRGALGVGSLHVSRGDLGVRERAKYHQPGLVAVSSLAGGWGQGGRIPHHSECPQPNPGGITLSNCYHILLSQKLDLLLRRDALHPFSSDFCICSIQTRGSSPLGQRANSMGGHPGMGGTWPCTSDPVVKLDCWPFTTPWMGKHQWSWMVPFHLESC